MNQLKNISYFVRIFLLFFGFFFCFFLAKESKGEVVYTGKPIHVFYDGLATQPAFMGMIDLVQLPKEEIKVFAWHRFPNRSDLMDLKELNAIEVPVVYAEGHGLANVSPVLEKLKEVMNENPKSPVVVWTNANNINYFFDLFFPMIDKKRIKHIHLYEDGVGELFTHEKRFSEFSYSEEDIQDMNDYWFNPDQRKRFPEEGRYLLHHLFPVTYHFFGLKKAKQDPVLKSFFEKMKGALFIENDFEALRDKLSISEKQKLYRLIGFDEQKYRKIFKENKVIIFVGGHYQNRGHLSDHGEVTYINELKKKYPNYVFLLKPHPSFDAFDKTKYVLDHIPGIEIINAQLPYEIFHIAGLKPTKIAGRTSSIFYSISNDIVDSYIAHPSYANGLDKYIKLDKSKEVDVSKFIPENPYFYDAKIRINNKEDYLSFLSMGEVYLYHSRSRFNYQKLNDILILNAGKPNARMFQKDNKGVYQPLNEEAHLSLVHPYWSDELFVKENNTYCRMQGDCGKVKKHSSSIEICWDQWGCEIYEKKEDGKYYLKQ